MSDLDSLLKTLDPLNIKEEVIDSLKVKADIDANIVISDVNKIIDATKHDKPTWDINNAPFSSSLEDIDWDVFGNTFLNSLVDGNGERFTDVGQIYDIINDRGIVDFTDASSLNILHADNRMQNRYGFGLMGGHQLQYNPVIGNNLANFVWSNTWEPTSDLNQSLHSISDWSVDYGSHFEDRSWTGEHMDEVAAYGGNFAFRGIFGETENARSVGTSAWPTSFGVDYGNRNPYNFLHSNFYPNGSFQGLEYEGTFTNTASLDVNYLSGNLIQNMYRYDIEDSKVLFTPAGGQLHPDTSNPFALSGPSVAYDFETVEVNYQGGPSHWGITPSIFMTGFIEHKYNELQKIIETGNGQQPGHYIKTNQDSLVFIPQPEVWESLGNNKYHAGSTEDIVQKSRDWTWSDAGPFEYAVAAGAHTAYDFALTIDYSNVTPEKLNEKFHVDANTDKLMNTIQSNDYIVQGDFVSKFGNSHELLAVWQGRNQFVSPFTLNGTDISGLSFYSENHNKIPGLSMSYTSGPSLFALGNNYDPYSKEIRSLRFGTSFPTPHNVFGTYVNPIDEQSIFTPENSPLLKKDRQSHHALHNSMAYNLVNAHFDYEGVRYMVGSPVFNDRNDWTPMEADNYNGSLANLGWGNHHLMGNAQGQTYGGNAVEFGAGKGEISDYIFSNAGNLHTQIDPAMVNSDIVSADRWKTGNGMPNFGQVLLNNGYTEDDVNISDSLAWEQGKKNWMVHTKFLLENSSRYGEESPIGNIITQGIDQLQQALDVVGHKNLIEEGHKDIDYDNLDEYLKTEEGQQWYEDHKEQYGFTGNLYEEWERETSDIAVPYTHVPYISSPFRSIYKGISDWLNDED